jgi:hypothetical protein
MLEARRSVYARVLWLDEHGKSVTWEQPAKQGYAKGTVPKAEPEYPQQPEAMPDQWTQSVETLRAPLAAKQARLELYLQWAADTQVVWSDATLTVIIKGRRPPSQGTQALPTRNAGLPCLGGVYILAQAILSKHAKRSKCQPRTPSRQVLVNTPG